MVSQLLRLKLRLMANGFRRPAAQWIAGAVGLGVALVIVIAILAAVPFLHGQDDGFVRRVVIIGGSLLSLAAFLLPLMTSRSQLLDPQALRGYGFLSGIVALVLLMLSLAGPLILAVPLALAPVGVWRDQAALITALLVAPLLLLQGLLSVRLGIAAGAALAHSPSWRIRVRVIGSILLLGGLLTFVVAILPRVTPLMPQSTQSLWSVLLRLGKYLRVGEIADVLQWTPLGVLWAAPAHPTLREPELTGPAVLYGLSLVIVLLLAWLLVVRYEFQGSRRIPIERRGGVPTWFRRLPSTPTGAIAARSFIYWVRDPRYRTVFAVIPFFLAGAIVAMWIGGMPLTVAALIPLPILVVLLAWSTTHNDVAYDSSAVWTHVVAQTRGVDDRAGRVVPALLFGSLLILIGAPVSIWLNGDWNVLPAFVGVCLALLLGSVGVASGFSARFPYAAARPGDPAFSLPQSSNTVSSGGGAQAGSFLLSFVVALPAVAALVLYLMQPEFPWTWIALIAGVVAGVLALVVGIRAGGATFDRRGPELLAFTMQN